MSFDKETFAKHLRQKAVPPFGKGQCARYVREALEAGGFDTNGHPTAAKDYGKFLERKGLSSVSKNSRLPGDIAVFEAVKGHSNGHVQGWDGRNWISDFVQPDFYPGSSYAALHVGYKVYR